MDTQILLTLFISAQSIALGWGAGSFMHLFKGHTVNGRLASACVGMVVAVTNLAVMVRIVPGIL